jgi:hypothetical protein
MFADEVQNKPNHLHMIIVGEKFADHWFTRCCFTTLGEGAGNKADFSGSLDYSVTLNHDLIRNSNGSQW